MIPHMILIELAEKYQTAHIVLLKKKRTPTRIVIHYT
jgi:hypothetical protein